MKEVPDPSKEDIILLFRFLALVGKLNKKISEKDNAVRAQQFEVAVKARNEEVKLRVELNDIQDKFEAITDKYTNL